MELCEDCNTIYLFLTNKIATTWNTLPSYVVEIISVESFKARLDKHVQSLNKRKSKKVLRSSRKHQLNLLANLLRHIKFKSFRMS